MSKTQIPVEKGTRERLYDVKRGKTWDVLLTDMLAAYKRALRAKARGKGGRRGETKAKGRNVSA